MTIDPLLIHQSSCLSLAIKDRQQTEGEEEILEERINSNPSINIEPTLLKRKSKNKSFYDILQSRRSVRIYGNSAVSLSEVSSVLWAAYGVTENCPFARRTVPSAGGLYPIRVYLWVNSVQGMHPGFYIYSPGQSVAVLNPDISAPENIGDWFSAKHVDYYNVAFSILLVGRFNQLCTKYGARGYRYLLMEAGHINQNISLACAILNLPQVSLGGFDDEKINNALCFSTANEACLYASLVGKHL